MRANRKRFKKMRYAEQTDEQKRKHITRALTRYYERLGKIEKQACEVCGEKAVERHHLDYRLPFAIRWLCKKHHLEAHGRVRAAVA
jgi:hypothetical protein